MAKNMNPWTRLLSDGYFPICPGVWDGFTARLAEHNGFRAAVVGGFIASAAAGSAEPLLNAHELLATCFRVKRASNLPLLVDTGAGFGDPIHVVRLVKDLRLLGIEGMMIEDQVFPKRSHYHRDYREHLISTDQMLAKIRWAKEIAGDDLYVVARTDSFATHGADEAIRRCRAFLEAGADAVMAFPNTMEEAVTFPGKIPGHVWFANLHGNRVGRPILTPRQLKEFGYAALADGWIFFMAAFSAIQATIAGFTLDGGFPAPVDAIGVRKAIEEAMHFDEMYRIEEQTTEREPSGGAKT
jgi:methylisocitrate lyase